MRLSSLWTDHAVVQRNKPIVVWGWCEKRVVLRATLGSSSAVGASSWDGHFELRLPALPEGGPYDLRVWTATGKEECICRDILVGEVWLVSGQSNAEFPLRTFLENDPLEQTPQYLAEGGDDPWLRCITTRDDALASPGALAMPGPSWQLSTPETCRDFTAIGAWFALFLRQKFPAVPVGIIHSAWGGTPVFAWCSRNLLAESAYGREMLAENDDFLSREEIWKGVEETDLESARATCGVLTEKDFEALTQKDRGNHGEALGYALPAFDDTAWKPMSVPGSWIGQKICGHGAVWFRKEVDLPESWAGQPLQVQFGGVDKHDVTYFNGTKIGATGQGFDTQYWNMPRCYDVPAATVHAGRNLLAVRTFCFYFDGAFTGTKSLYSLKNCTTGETIPLCGDDWKAFPEYSFEVGGVNETFGGPISPISPHRLFDNKILPLVPYGIRGALWYQGESDTDTQPRTDHYRELFAGMIRDWRRFWAQGDEFPFYFVQLANWETPVPDRWVAIQDAQRRTALEVPNTGCITGNDLALFEPSDIHPHDKRSFGYRLFLEALANTYGDKDVIPQGPTMDKVTPEGTNALRVHFLYAKGLHAKDGKALRAFEVAGEDGKFVPAEAQIDGDCVVLSAATVPAPKHCRYNTSVAEPDGNLVNAAELPALVFLD